MASEKDEKTSERKALPTPGMAFLVGWIVFAAILSPLGVLGSFYFKLWSILDIILLQALTVGCFLGLFIAIIPAFIFMQITVKKIKLRKK